MIIRIQKLFVHLSFPFLWGTLFVIASLAIAQDLHKLDFNVVGKGLPQDFRWLPRSIQNLLEEEAIETMIPGGDVSIEIGYRGADSFEYSIRLTYGGKGIEIGRSGTFWYQSGQALESVSERVKRDVIYLVAISVEEVRSREATLDAGIDRLFDVTHAVRMYSDGLPYNREADREYAIRNQPSAKEEYYRAARSHMAGANGRLEEINAGLFNQYMSTKNIQAIQFYVEAMARLERLTSVYEVIDIDTRNPMECLILAHVEKIKGRSKSRVQEYFRRAIRYGGERIGSRAFKELEK